MALVLYSSVIYSISLSLCWICWIPSSLVLNWFACESHIFSNGIACESHELIWGLGLWISWFESRDALWIPWVESWDALWIFPVESAWGVNCCERIMSWILVILSHLVWIVNHDSCVHPTEKNRIELNLGLWHVNLCESWIVKMVNPSTSVAESKTAQIFVIFSSFAISMDYLG